MTRFLSRFLADETGATAMEYGLMLPLLALAIVTAVTAIGTGLNTKFTSLSNALR